MTDGICDAMTAEDEVALRRSLAVELLQCGRMLQRVHDLPQLMHAILPVIQAQLVYSSIWLYLLDPHNPAEFQLLSISGGQAAPIAQLVPTATPCSPRFGCPTRR